jgi:hypothetical protein
MWLIADVQFCVDDFGGYHPKLITFSNSIAGSNVHSFVIKFDNPEIFQNSSRHTNIWLQKYLHGYHYFEGEHHLSDVKNFITENMVEIDVIFTKGKRKVDFFKSFLNFCNIYDLENFGCPSIRLLLDAKLSRREYSKSIVLSLKNWIYKNGHKLPHISPVVRQIRKSFLCWCFCCRQNSI